MGSTLEKAMRDMERQKLATEKALEGMFPGGLAAHMERQKKMLDAMKPQTSIMQKMMEQHEKERARLAPFLATMEKERERSKQLWEQMEERMKPSPEIQKMMDELQRQRESGTDLVSQVNRLSLDYLAPRVREPAWTHEPIELPLHKTDPAQYLVEVLQELVIEFQATLNADEEIGISLTDAAIPQTLWLHTIRARGTQHIELVGQNAAGERVTLLRHHTQPAVQLTATLKQNPDEPARRIGFDLE